MCCIWKISFQIYAAGVTTARWTAHTNAVTSTQISIPCNLFLWSFFFLFFFKQIFHVWNCIRDDAEFSICKRHTTPKCFANVSNWIRVYRKEKKNQRANETKEKKTQADLNVCAAEILGFCVTCCVCTTINRQAEERRQSNTKYICMVWIYGKKPFEEKNYQFRGRAFFFPKPFITYTVCFVCDVCSFLAANGSMEGALSKWRWPLFHAVRSFDEISVFHFWIYLLDQWNFWWTHASQYNVCFI